jgi:hypothetical protein
MVAVCVVVVDEMSSRLMWHGFLVASSEGVDLTSPLLARHQQTTMGIN